MRSVAALEDCAQDIIKMLCINLLLPGVGVSAAVTPTQPAALHFPLECKVGRKCNVDRGLQ